LTVDSIREWWDITVSELRRVGILKGDGFEPGDFENIT